MSLEATKAVWEHSKSKGSARLVMLCLAYHMNDKTGECYPSIATIAKETGVSDRQVTRAIQQLVKDGELEIVSKGNGRGNATEYRILLAIEKGDNTSIKHDTMSGFPVVRKGDNTSERVTSDTEKGDNTSERVTSDTEKGDTMSPQQEEKEKELLPPLPVPDEVENIRALAAHFQSASGILPSRTLWEEWEVGLKTILAGAGNDMQLARRRITRAVRLARDGTTNGNGRVRRYNIKSPASITTIVANLPPEDTPDSQPGVLELGGR